MTLECLGNWEIGFIMNNVRVSVKIRMGARVAPCIETPDQAGKFFCIFLFHPPKIKF